MSTTGISVGILIAILIIMIIYVVMMFEFYKNKKFIFAPYNQPKPNSPHFYPLGKITPMTQEEIDHRNEIINASRKAY